MDLSAIAGAVAIVTFLCLPLLLSLWALLDAARRPSWAWSLADRSQVTWIAAVLVGTFMLLPGMVISTWYLVKVRPLVSDAEGGQVRSRKRDGGGP